MWPIIKKAVNSDLSTPLNIPINAIKAKTDLITQIKSKTDLITGKYQLFLANGTFVVPAGVNAVYLTGCAAGNAGSNGDINGYNGGNGGNGGEMIFDFLIPNVTPGQSIAVTTGAGNTVFGTYLTLVKGAGAAGGAAGANGAAGESMGMPYRGRGGIGGGGTSYGGGGGGAFGVGGNGGASTLSDGQPGTGYGTGGGGGAFGYGVKGGAGRPGFLFVRWL